jgi:hypothetical protein
MMSPASTPPTGEATRNTGSHGYGLVLFASILLAVTGCANSFDLAQHFGHTFDYDHAAAG